MACETYDDGSYFCEYAGGYWEYGDAYGNVSYGSSQTGDGLDYDRFATTIGDTLSSIFGGGQRGYYAPNRNQQPYSYPGPGPYYPQNQQGFNAGLNRQGAGFNISTNTLIIGGVVLLAFMLGTKRGR